MTEGGFIARLYAGARRNNSLVCVGLDPELEKIPQHIRFVPDFPSTATGKPQKFVMREQLMRELGVAEQKTA